MNQPKFVQEIAMLRSLAVSIVGRDSEGMYRKEFVAKVLRALKSVPTKRFHGKDAFLAELRKRS